MRLLILAAVLAPAVAAADPAWDSAVAARRLAQAEHSLRAAVPRWEAAGRAFDAIATADAAFAGAEAWDHAVRGTPHAVASTGTDGEPLDAHEQRVVDDVTQFFARAASGDPRVADALLLRAQTYWRRDRFAEAEPDLRELATQHATTNAGARAAELLIDSLNRTQRFDDLQRLVATLRARGAYDAKLAGLLLRLDVAFTRRDAERAADAEDWRRCVERYDRAAELAPLDERVDEVLYNAARCTQASGDIGEALVRLRALVRRAPGSALTARAYGLIAALAASVGDFAGAAEAFEHAGGNDGLANAIELRSALGQDAADDADLARWMTLAPEPRAWAPRLLGLAHSRVAHGARAAARKAFDRALAIPHGDPAPDLVIAGAWALACPVAQIGGLCVDHGVPVARDPHYMALALATARRAPDAPGTSIVTDAAAREASLQPGAMPRDLAPVPRAGTVAPDVEPSANLCCSQGL